LNRLNIKTVGAGENINDAYQCKVISKKGTRFGFLGFNNVMGSIGKAGQKYPGIAWLDNDAINAIKKCKGRVDQLVVMANWGIEYQHTPRKKEKNLAYKMVDAGADIILGDQAHWVQNKETYKLAHISYGLGNYIFDQHWSKNTTEGIIQKIVFYNNQRIYIDTIPVQLIKTGEVVELNKTSDRYQNVLNAYYGIPN
jgi:poly-gamma-glutamate synthesis protein (capsule biosynthesis protein)